MLPNRNTFKIVVLVLLATLSVGSCSSLTKYALNQEFNILLPSDGASGFVWEYEPNPGIQLVDSTIHERQLENGFYVQDKEYLLKGKNPGMYTIKFIKKRAFDPSLVVKENIRELRIKIKNKE